MNTEKDTEIIDAEKIVTDLTYFNQVEEGLTTLEARYADVPDATTKTGMVALKKGLAEMRPLRTAVDKRRLALGSKYRQAIKDINSVGRDIIDRILVVELPYQTAKKREESRIKDAEDNRIAVIKSRCNSITAFFDQIEGLDAAGIESVLTELRTLDIDESFEELEPKARSLKAQTIEKILLRLASVSQSEEAAQEKQNEIEKLEEEQSKQNARLAKAQAELDAQKAIQDAERKLLEEQAQKLRDADQARINAESKLEDAKAQAAQDRLQAEQDKIDTTARIEKERAQVERDKVETAAQAERDKLEAIAQAERDKLEAIAQAERNEAEAEQNRVAAVEAEEAADDLLKRDEIAKQEAQKEDTVLQEARVAEATEAMKDVAGLKNPKSMEILTTIIEAIKAGKIPHVTWNWIGD